VLGAHPVMAVRDIRWKLIRTYELDNRQHVAFTELYDLVHDPHEMQNLADLPVHAQRVAGMVQRIAEHGRTVGRP
jgi:hypothetical protein